LLWLIVLVNLIIRKLSRARPFVTLCDFGHLYVISSGECCKCLCLAERTDNMNVIVCILQFALYILAIFGPLFCIWMKVALRKLF
jgi:hypothetical protein